MANLRWMSRAMFPGCCPDFPAVLSVAVGPRILHPWNLNSLATTSKHSCAFLKELSLDTHKVHPDPHMGNFNSDNKYWKKKWSPFLAPRLPKASLLQQVRSQWRRFGGLHPSCAWWRRACEGKANKSVKQTWEIPAESVWFLFFTFWKLESWSQHCDWFHLEPQVLDAYLGTTHLSPVKTGIA